jgi:hypothetical protein
MATIGAYESYASDTAASVPTDNTLPPEPRTAAEQRFRSALVCLGAAYALSWAELALAIAIGFPGDASSHPLAASIVSRLLVGLLYLCVAARLQWARWMTVALGFVSVMFVAPTIALQWHALPTGAIICGAALVCKLAASLYLVSRMPLRATA